MVKLIESERDVDKEISNAYAKGVEDSSEYSRKLAQELNNEVVSLFVDAEAYKERIFPEDRKRIIKVITDLQALVCDTLDKYKSSFESD